MSIERQSANARDPRAVLVQEKYFSMRPKPLEQWLWSQGLPATAERVFWVHWDAGVHNGDWCSSLSLREVARRCHVDPSTITRAYQLLKRLELIRREEPGRDPLNPFRQAIAVTEVRLPRALLTELSRYPNRRRAAAAIPQPSPTPAVSAPEERAAGPLPEAPARPAEHLKFADYQRIQGRFSAREKAAYQRAWADAVGRMAFDPDSAVSAAEQRHILWQLHLQAQPVRAAAARPEPGSPGRAPTRPAAFAAPRQLNALEAARLRAKLASVLTAAALAEVFREVLWAVEEGALRRFPVPLAVNTAVKKIREGAWTRPNRMPPNWLRGEGRLRALTETCVAA